MWQSITIASFFLDQAEEKNLLNHPILRKKFGIMKNRTNTTNTHNNTPWVLCCTTSGLARSLWGMDLIIWYFPCSKGHYQPITSDTRTWVFMAKTVSIISHYNYIVLKKKTTSQLHLGFPPHIYPTHLTHFFFLCWISTYFFFSPRPIYWKTYYISRYLLQID